jgi:hypothetical protein
MGKCLAGKVVFPEVSGTIFYHIRYAVYAFFDDSHKLTDIN